MIKQESVKITQGPGLTDTTVTLSSTGNVIITSILASSDAIGVVDFIRSDDGLTMFRASVNSNVTPGSTSFLFPVFMLKKVLLIRTNFADTSIINVIINYIDATADNPLFEPSSHFTIGYVSNDTATDTLMFSNSSSDNLNIKSVHATSNNTANDISLFLESPLFTPKIEITNIASGLVAYQLLSNPFVLKPGEKLYVRQSLAEPVTAYASIVKLTT